MTRKTCGDMGSVNDIAGQILNRTKDRMLIMQVRDGGTSKEPKKTSEIAGNQGSRIGSGTTAAAKAAGAASRRGTGRGKGISRGPEGRSYGRTDRRGNYGPNRYHDGPDRRGNHGPGRHYGRHHHASGPVSRPVRRTGNSKTGLVGGLLLVLIIILVLILLRDYTRGGSSASLKEENTSYTYVEETSVDDQSMEVHFMDVGQGDATLIQCGDEYLLIDAGDNSQGTRIQAYLKKLGVEKLDYLVLTHTDSDHIGGADVIISKFDVETVFLSDYKKDNSTYEDLVSALEYKHLTHSLPELGRAYTLGNAKITFIAPNDTYDTPNDSSIALVVEHGENSFLFTGDCEEQAEKDILEAGYDVDCDVYKLGHHGSATSNSEEFLNAVTPEYGVISCEEGNAYGHPHAEPLNRLRAMGTLLFRTDEQGTVIACSDGEKLTWNCAPSDTWQVGERTQ